MSHDATETLNDLIEILRDGQRFYESATPKVTDSALKTLFRNATATRAALIADLSSEVRSEGRTPSASGTFVGGVRDAYADVLAAMSSDRNATYVSQLEAAEDRLLHAFERALKEVEAPRVRQILATHFLAVQKMHDAMSHQKHMRAA